MTPAGPSPDPELNLDFAPVDADRIAVILADESLEYAIEVPHPEASFSSQVRTGFINQSILLQAGDNGLGAVSTWRGRLAPEDAAKGLAMVNEWNLHQMAPVVYMLESESHEIAFAARRTLGSPRASTNQLGAFLVSTIDSFVAVWDYFESALPDSVTWTEPEAD